MRRLRQANRPRSPRALCELSNCRDTAATRDDLREAVETFEDAGQIARRVLGDAHPLTEWIEDGLQDAQDALYARGLP